MSVYVLKDRTYNTVTPSEEDEASSFEPSDAQIVSLFREMREMFGCYVMFGITLDGRMRMFKSPSSPMEDMAMNRFIETIMAREADLDYSLLDDGSDMEDFSDEEA